MNLISQLFKIQYQNANIYREINSKLVKEL